jgi:hypothetical protein
LRDDTRARLGANEAVFRQINEGIERGQWPGEEDAPISFRCECAQLGCNELLELSVNDYEAVRSNPRRFLVLPGHQQPDAETVVETHERYLVVEKLAQAGMAAEDTDPRS